MIRTTVTVTGMFGIFGVFSRPDDRSETAQPAGFPVSAASLARIAAIGGDPRWITLRAVQTGILPASANQL